ncbi:cation/H(+) antiporter 15-like [Impatiens glandulifera]|uniref:cation/H(+) antiporter 15-like n=1 Tax=Impatiens glandulifera TaxID=253017 RepID=UPI001FB05799|nr:cation/H(+) antiporter 15-like [Impatiens glandulifera]
MASDDETVNEPIYIGLGLLANETVCYPTTLISSGGIWTGDNPSNFALPTFIYQTIVMLCLNRLIVFFLRPMRFPRVVAELLSGIIIGPSMLGTYGVFVAYVMPKRSVILMELMSTIGMTYYVFLLGLEMDLSIVKSNFKMALPIAIMGMLPPFFVGCAFSFMLHKYTTIGSGNFLIIFSVALSSTSLPALGRTLQEFRLFDLDIGRLSISAALITNTISVCLVVIAISIGQMQGSVFPGFMVILSFAVFVSLQVFLIGPGVTKLIMWHTEEDSLSEIAMSLVLAGVMMSAVVTDAIGMHALVGAFTFGLVIPYGPFAMSLIDRLEDFVLGFLVPIFFMTSGLKTNLSKIQGASTWGMLIVAAVTGAAGKVAGTLFGAVFYQMPIKDGLSLGLLMNTKPAIELIALNIGKDQHVIDDITFAMIEVLALVMTVFIMPIVTTIYKPGRKLVHYKRRTIQRTRGDVVLRVITCIHNPRNVPTIVNLLEASHPTKRSPLAISTLHLIELTGHGSSTIIVHGTEKSEHPIIERVRGQSENIINAFHNFERQSHFVSVKNATAISLFPTMHEQVTNFAEEMRAAVIIVPFNKQTIDDTESSDLKTRAFNENLLANAPCSVCILIDRGMTGSTKVKGKKVSHHIALLFFGGPDDREALSYAMRMSEDPANNLTVIRFLPGNDAVKTATMEKNKSGVGSLTLQIDKEKEEQLDEDILNEFKMLKTNDKSFTYKEMFVNNGEETLASIRTVDRIHELFIVGRTQETSSLLVAGLSEWNEFQELGIIGDLLCSAEFMSTTSVLVVQQYLGAGAHDDGIRTPDNVAIEEQFMN